MNEIECDWVFVDEDQSFVPRVFAVALELGYQPTMTATDLGNGRCKATCPDGWADDVIEAVQEAEANG